MQYYAFLKHELKTYNVINIMIDLVEKEKEKNKNFQIDRDSYIWIIGEKVAKSSFQNRPITILGFRAIYEDKNTISSMSIAFKNNSSAVIGRSCATCRFNECCPYVGCCIDHSHWLEMTEAQKFEKILHKAVDSLCLHDMSAKKLVGDISSGYSYVNPYTAAQIEESKRRAKEMDSMIDTDNVTRWIKETSFKNNINSIYGAEKINYNEMYVKKEDKDMRRRNLCIGYMPGGPVGNSQDLIEDVIFSGPCTIVKWKDGDKTIVRCQEGEDFDKEKGLAMCIVKKFLGTNNTRSNFNDIFEKWIPNEEYEDESLGNAMLRKFKDAWNTALTGCNTRYYTVKTYSEKFGISETKVRKMCREGELNAHKQDGAWIIDIKE